MRSFHPWLLGGMLIGWLGCATGPEVCQRDPITGSRQCSMTSSSPGEAVATAAIAAGAWTVAGCTVNGCLPPYQCNSQTKQCERIRCGEDKQSCPPAYSCDPIDNLCK